MQLIQSLQTIFQFVSVTVLTSSGVFTHINNGLKSVYAGLDCQNDVPQDALMCIMSTIFTCRL